MSNGLAKCNLSSTLKLLSLLEAKGRKNVNHIFCCRLYTLKFLRGQKRFSQAMKDGKKYKINELPVCGF